MRVEAIYLGDGVYAEFDGYTLWIYTHNGIYETNRIALEPSALKKLEEYRKKIEDER